MDLRKKEINATLVFLVRGEGEEREILLAKKVRKLVVGCLTGFGGSINKRETPRKGITRELGKESGLEATRGNFEFVGVMQFHNQREDGSEFFVRVFIFFLYKWRGRPKLKKDEMVSPKWYRANRLPYAQMPPADVFWIPYILAGKKIKGKAWYGPDQRTMLRTPEVKIVKSLSDVD